MATKTTVLIGSSLAKEACLGDDAKLRRYIFLRSLHEVNNDHVKNRLKEEMKSKIVERTDTITIAAFGNTFYGPNHENIQKPGQLQVDALVPNLFWLIKTILEIASENQVVIKSINLLSPTPRRVQLGQFRNQLFYIEYLMTQITEYTKVKIDNDCLQI